MQEPESDNAPAAADNDDDLPQFVAEEVGRAFPDFRCLRCRNDTFFLTGSYLAGQIVLNRDGQRQSHATGPAQTIALVCERCGFVEQHVAEIFLDADKPIPIGK
jgi:predicted nucleic-acid-binding Zn-ribbon protein